MQLNGRMIRLRDGDGGHGYLSCEKEDEDEMMISLFPLNAALSIICQSLSSYFCLFSCVLSWYCRVQSSSPLDFYFASSHRVVTR